MTAVAQIDTLTVGTTKSSLRSAVFGGMTSCAEATYWGFARAVFRNVAELGVIIALDDRDVVRAAARVHADINSVRFT